VRFVNLFLALSARPSASAAMSLAVRASRTVETGAAASASSQHGPFSRQRDPLAVEPLTAALAARPSHTPTRVFHPGTAAQHTRKGEGEAQYAVGAGC